MSLEEVSVEVKRIGGFLGPPEYEFRLPMGGGRYHSYRLDEETNDVVKKVGREKPAGLTTEEGMTWWWYQGKFYVAPEDYEQIDVQVVLWERHQEKQRAQARTQDQIVLHTCPVCLKGPVVQHGKSGVARLVTRARLVCEECGSVLEEERGIYRYKSISPNCPQGFLAGRFHSSEELSDLAEAGLKPLKEHQAKRRRLAAEKEVQSNLQPMTLSQFFGQPRIRENLLVAIQAAKARAEPLGHVLLCGPEGCGKRSLALVIGNEMDVQQRWVASLQDLQEPAHLRDLFAMRSASGDLHPSDTLFIDDIHRLPPAVQEFLYPIMRQFVIHKLVLPRFTLIGATDQPNRVSPLLRQSFQHVFEFEPYDDVALGQLVQRRAEVLGMDIEDEACWELGRGAKGTIREAERLLDRARDYAQVKGEGTVTLDVARWAVHGTVPASGKGEPQPDALTWQEFEDFVAKLFGTLGYQNVRVTPRVANGGKDVVMEWADPLRGTRTLYVECKHWQAGSVGRREVQILHSAVMANPEVDGGVIVTTGTFTDGAVDYAKRVGVIQLIDRKELRELMRKAGILETNE